MLPGRANANRPIRKGRRLFLPVGQRRKPRYPLQHGFPTTTTSTTIFSAPERTSSARGFPNQDSDIYGNLLSHCWDDGIESGVPTAIPLPHLGQLHHRRLCRRGLCQHVHRAAICLAQCRGTIRESPSKIAGAFLKTSNRMGGGKILAFTTPSCSRPACPTPAELRAPLSG